MKAKTPAVLAIDTSNYTTSVAVIDKFRNVIFDKRESLKVKEGERGLRQSHALFQHNLNVPFILEELFPCIEDQIKISCISVSDRPRPLEGSYMPVFMAGVSFARATAAALSVPLFRFSHQEGHLAAATYGNDLTLEDRFLAFHLSGGTTELLLVNNGSIEKVGGTMDITFGQVIDRIGVNRGLKFPSGALMDELALSSRASLEKTIFKGVRFNALDINLSGLESQALRWIKEEEPGIESISAELFKTISETLIRWSCLGMEETGCKKINFIGGVASSKVIRAYIADYSWEKDVEIYFGSAGLSTDNAVGIGLLGAKKLWQ